MTTHSIAIDPARLMADLRELARFGQVETGVDRTAFSEPDIEARRWVHSRMQAAGLEADIDAVGNVVGRSPASGPRVCIGSHTDSVPRGGWLDGSMGVMYGLEIARAALDAGFDGPIDVVSFQDEEGTFFPCLGSRSFCGDIDEAAIDAAKGPGGVPLREVLERNGLHTATPARLDTDSYRGYFEAHIEQGPRLEAAGKRIGIVTAIVGIRRYRIQFEGRADHAGTTPMHMRQDAGAALFACGERLARLMRESAGPNTVWNLGVATIEPGAANVVPSHASMIFELRDTDADRIETLSSLVAAAVEEAGRACGVRATSELIGAIPPVPMDRSLMQCVSRSADDLGTEWMDMPSGAGHDAMVMARFLPTAMLFVPSIGGRSHDVSEDTAEEDIVHGCEVLAGAVEKLLRAT